MAEALRSYRCPIHHLGLPSALAHPIRVLPDGEPPRPRLHAAEGRGMTVTVGRIQSRPVHHVRLVALVNNTIRGAAGAAILNAELMAVRWLLDDHSRAARRAS